MSLDRITNVETWIRGHYFGKYRGRVADNQDPTQRGRLLVRVPAVLEDLQVWAMPCVPYAGPGVGLYCLPPVDAGVWVEFEGGDPSFPIWTGCFWADGEVPSEASTVDTRILRTEQAQLKIDDASGEVVLTNQNDAKVTLDTQVTAEAGGATHTVGAEGVVSESIPGKVEVGASGVTVNNGAFTVS